MNKKQYQKIAVTVQSGELVSISERLRNDFQLATGLFFVSNQSLNDVTCAVRIDGQEILPAGTDASLFRWTDTISRSEALWDFYSERIAAKSAAVEADFVNGGSNDVIINVYILLENEQ